MAAMLRTAFAVVLAVLLPGLGVAATAQPSVTGEWAVSFTTPMGTMEFAMAVTQNGTALTGHLSSDVGEFPLKGTVDGDQVTINWTLNDGGKMVDITFKGKIDANGNAISGTATLGKIGQGAFSAERTGS